MSVDENGEQKFAIFEMNFIIAILVTHFKTDTEKIIF